MLCGLLEVCEYMRGSVCVCVCDAFIAGIVVRSRCAVGWQGAPKTAEERPLYVCVCVLRGVCVSV